MLAIIPLLYLYGVPMYFHWLENYSNNLQDYDYDYYRSCDELL